MQLFANNVTVFITNPISSVDRTIVVDDASKLPSITGSDFILITFFDVDNKGVESNWEIVKVTGKSGNTLTVPSGGRGFDGTTARGWGSGAVGQMRGTGSAWRTTTSNAEVAFNNAASAVATANNALTQTGFRVLSSDLAASDGSKLAGFILAGAGAILRTVLSKLRDIPGIRDFGGIVDGATDDATAMRALIVGGDVELRGGNALIKSGMAITTPVCMDGRGAITKITAASDFASDTDLLTLSPAAGTEKRNWAVENFLISVADGSAVKNIFTIDLTAAGKFLNKLSVKNIVAEAGSGWFVELVNPTNVDGLFCSVFEDNWSLKGYKLDNIGDSVFFVRNTVSGSGPAFHVNQLGTASHVVIRDGNYTSDGGALYATQSINLEFSGNQVEAPNVFTGFNNALISFQRVSGTATHQNSLVKRNSINTMNNAALCCIYANWTNNLNIDENTLSTNPTTGCHIYLDVNANDTYIGSNKYYSSTTGSEIDPIITDLGTGTMGIWKNATLATSWTLASTTYGFPVGYFKTRDGNILLRGNLAGAAPGASMLLFTLPVGFRPKTKVITMYKPYSGAASVAFQIEANGNVTLLTSTATSIYLDGVTFSTR